MDKGRPFVVVVQGLGQFRNDDDDDVDAIAVTFVEELLEAGAAVEHAAVLVGVESEPLIQRAVASMCRSRNLD